MEVDSSKDDELDIALAEFMRRRDAGEALDRNHFLSLYPQLADRLAELLSIADSIESLAGPKFEELFPVPHATTDSSSITLIPRTPTTKNNRAAVEPTLIHRRSWEDRDAGDDEIDGVPGPSQLPRRFGDYILEKVLGRGGMGVVYLGRQISLERMVAVKMIRSGSLATDEEVQRFYAEAKSAAKLDHPNIVTVHQCGEESGHHFFSMDYIPGTDLSKKMAEGPLHPRDAARYVRDVALAIAFAHSQGVVHRDLKPANVLINERDEVVVTDFGLAKWLDSDSGLTSTGTTIGTPSYMSPEQATGRTNEHGEATDIYSLGAILFSLLSGRPPFQAESVVETMMKVVHQPAPLIRELRKEIHVDLETIIHKCLHKQPHRRYQSAVELAADLERFLNGQPVSARPLSKTEKLGRWMVGIPIIAALSGNRAHDPSATQRWAQRLMLLVLLSLSIYLLFGRSLSQKWFDDHLPRQISVAAGIPGGAYHSLASQLAKQLADRVQRATTVGITEGSMDNTSMLLHGLADLALLQETSVQSGDLAVVAPLYYESVHVLVRSDIPIQSIEELRGRRVSLGPVHSGSRQASRRILNFFAMSESDFQVSSEDWLQLGRQQDIEAAIVVMKVGQPAVNELISSRRFRLIPLQPAMTISLEDPAFHPIEIRPSDYPDAGFDRPLTTLATTAFLACRRNAPNRLIEETLAVLYDEQYPIRGILTPEQASKWQGLAWHPAARVFFERFRQNAN